MALKYHISGLPAGCTYDPDTGIVTGTPAVSPTSIAEPEKVYNLTVRVFGDKGLDAVRTTTWTIKHTVLVTFTAGGQTSFNPTVTLTGGASFIPQWDFGDGNTETSATPSHTYASIGTYEGSVRLSSQETVGLDFTDQGLTVLDVTVIPTLQELKCGENNLDTLDIAENTALTTLWCEENDLAALDVSALTALTDLRCQNNQLDTLDVSALTALTDLRCQYNVIDTLDVSALTNLTTLYCGNNMITTLDTSALVNMTTLSCEYNGISTLDCSAMGSLTSLDCQHNNITALSFSSTTLDFIAINNNQINQASLDALSAGLVLQADGIVETLDCKGQVPQAFLDPDDYDTLLTAGWTITADLVPDITVEEGDEAGSDFTLDLSDYLIGASTFGATGLPTGLTVNSGTGVLEGYVDGDQAGSHTVQVTGTGGNPANETFIITVTPVNLLVDRAGNLLTDRAGAVLKQRT